MEIKAQNWKFPGKKGPFLEKAWKPNLTANRLPKTPIFHINFQPRPIFQDEKPIQTDRPEGHYL